MKWQLLHFVVIVGVAGVVMSKIQKGADAPTGVARKMLLDVKTIAAFVSLVDVTSASGNDVEEILCA